MMLLDHTYNHRLCGQTNLSSDSSSAVSYLCDFGQIVWTLYEICVRCPTLLELSGLNENMNLKLLL